MTEYALKLKTHFRILWGKTRGGSSPPFRIFSRAISIAYESDPGAKPSDVTRRHAPQPFRYTSARMIATARSHLAGQPL